MLELRHKYLESKGIADRGHALTDEERGELTKRVRDEYEASEGQRVLQEKDIETGKANGKGWDGQRGSWR